MVRSINGRTLPAGRGMGQGSARSPGRKAWGVAALGLLLACGPRGLYEAKLVTEVCAGPPALADARYLRLRVTGPGMEPVEHYALMEQGVAEPPSVPAGKGRDLEVRG